MSRHVSATLAAALLAPPAGAQFQQYLPPGATGAEDAITRETLEQSTADARWRLGVLRLSPWLALRDASYDSNVFRQQVDQRGDFSATVGAGLRGYVRLGRKSTLALHALPEYVWWAELPERRRLNGRYGGGYFGFYNRLRLDARLTRSEEQRYLSSELQQPVDLTRSRGFGAVGLQLTSALTVFASGSREVRSYDETDAQTGLAQRLVELDRSEDVLRAGLSVSKGSSFAVSAGVEHSAADFRRVSGDRSNTGTSPILVLESDTPRARTDVSLAYRRLRPEPGSAFLPFDGVTGRARLVSRIGRRLSPELYARRNLVYSVNEPDSPFFLDERLGLALGVEVAQLYLRLFAETGRDDYRSERPEPRLDDVMGFGGVAVLRLGERFWLNLGASRLRYDSNIGGRDRTLFRLLTAISLGGGGSPWY